MLSLPAYAECETSRALPDTKGHPSACLNSQVSKPAAKPAHYKLLAKGTEMPEQNKGYMVKLDQWSEENVIFPLSLAVSNGNDESRLAATDAVKKAIRSKVLESYHNGQSAGPSKTFKRS